MGITCKSEAGAMVYNIISKFDIIKIGGNIGIMMVNVGNEMMVAG